MTSMSTKEQTTQTVAPAKVNPSALAPDFENISGELVADEHPFWLGVTADYPRGQIDVAGLHFPKNEESIIINDAGKQVRVPKIGTVNKTITRHNFDELVRLLPRLVVRVERVATEDQRAKGHLIKIPDAKAKADASESGRVLKPYVKRPGDRPATEFMYFVHAPSGRRGHEFQTISEAGIEWPFGDDVVVKPKSKSKVKQSKPAPDAPKGNEQQAAPAPDNPF